jgi:hypothetical protein
VKLVRAVATPHNLNLVAIEFPLAKNTNALIVKRLPSPELVSGTQDRQSIFGFEVSAHCPVKMSVTQAPVLHNQANGGLTHQSKT